METQDSTCMCNHDRACSQRVTQTMCALRGIRLGTSQRHLTSGQGEQLAGCGMLTFIAYPSPSAIRVYSYKLHCSINRVDG